MATSHAPVELGPAAFRALPPAAQAEAVIGGRTRFRPGEAFRILIMLGRPRTCVPGLFAYGLGLAYAGAPSAPYVVLGGLLALLVGFSANLHNTYTDVEEDCRNLPGRMWLLYRFGRTRLLLVLVALNLFMAGAALAYGRGFFVFVVLGLIGLHQYSFRPLRMKGRPLLGLYVFAQAVVGPFLVGWFIQGVRAPTGPVWAMLAYLFFWFVAKGFFKNVPDYDGDRAVGLRTSATVFPSRVAAARVAAAVTILAYLALPVLVATGASPPRVLFALPLTIVAAVQAWTLVRAADGNEANTVLRRDMVLSSAFLGVVLLLQEPTWTSVILVVVGVAVIAGTDLLAMDSRRSADAAPEPPPVRPGAAPEPPRDPRRARPATPQALFDRVAPRYDLFNSLLSGGSDRRWRRRAARLLDLPPGGTVLDVATGTAGLAIAVADAAPTADVTGCDINAAMLAVGEKKIADRGLEDRVHLVSAAGEDLPFDAGSFDAVCIAFAIDDMGDRRRCAAEMTRVLRPGGRLVLLELAVPEQPVLRSTYLAGLAVMSLLGKARGMDGYRHLREEITTYRGADAVRALLKDVGLRDYDRTPLTGGIAVLHTATKSGGSHDAGQ
jgi:ubiquinone/menaquinone biosynthesis methyltransferase